MLAQEHPTILGNCGGTASFRGFFSTTCYVAASYGCARSQVMLRGNLKLRQPRRECISIH